LMASRDYVKIANQYIKDVLSGKILACQHVKNACERQKSDLKRKDLAYRFDKSRAEKVCKFIEVLPHIKGIWAGKPIILEPWQVFLLTTVFGWVNKEGLRRFKTVYTEVPRKNAKSTLSSGVALYLLTADNEGGPEVYSAATTRDQARIVWEDAKRMVDRCPALREYFGVQTSAHSVFVPSKAGVFKALARDQGGNLDGLNIHGAVIDELHGHKTREVWDVVETATGARSQPLIWGITTAGFNRTGICYEQRAYTIKILDRVHTDEEYFGIIYTLDDTDDWADPKSWAKANPNWGVSVSPDDIARKARKAMEMAAATNNFLTKHLNIWVNADTAWMNMRAWDACHDPELTEEQFKGMPCWIALDLATKTDLAVYVKLFEREGMYYLFGKYYLPEEAAEDGRNSHYQGWARQDILTLTPGNITDFEYIENDIREEAAKYDIQKVAYDPWQANYLATRLMSEGLPMGEYRQTVQNMSEPMKQLEALVLSGKVRHSGCPILTWAISNVVGHLDAKENIYPRKEFPENKIDPAVAAIMALGEYMSTTNEGTSAYEDRPIFFL
jgi:phage terminase large subunit-like protein